MAGACSGSTPKYSARAATRRGLLRPQAGRGSDVEHADFLGQPQRVVRGKT